MGQPHKNFKYFIHGLHATCKHSYLCLVVVQHEESRLDVHSVVGAAHPRTGARVGAGVPDHVGRRYTDERTLHDADQDLVLLWNDVIRADVGQ